MMVSETRKNHNNESVQFSLKDGGGTLGNGRDGHKTRMTYSPVR